MKLSIIGLGKLGSPMAAVMAHKGHTIVGVDVNPAYVNAINRGLPPVEEPGLAEMIRTNRDRLSATQDYEPAILATEATFIIVPTPSGEDGKFSLSYVLSAAEKIGAALRKKTTWHLVVLSSTVMPGSMERVLVPALENYSGKQCGVDFGVCYNPEFIALGSVVRDMLNPDMILIGESDQRSGQILEEFYTQVCESNPRINRMNFVNAELTKLSVNTFVTTKISYANMLAEVCETLPGADVDVVTQAIGCDTRIGRKYLRGAMGYGGPCFPRDNVAFSALARTNGVPALLAEATDAVNRRQAPRLAEIIRSEMRPGGVAAVLGLSYKPSTGVIEESQGLRLAQVLLKDGIRVVVYDPEAMPNVKSALSGGAVFASSAAECVQQADAFAITTAWPEFSKLSTADLKRRDGSVLVLDCWRMLDRAAFAPACDYHVIGAGIQPRVAAATEA